MKPRTRTVLCAGIVMMLGLMALAGSASAQSGESSSWSSTTSADKKRPAAKDKAAPKSAVRTKSIKTTNEGEKMPEVAPTKKAAAAAPPAKTAIAPKPGDDAAYEAFDQGRYITALNLALKAAEAGDPQAHTLIGRIYADGYGTPKNAKLGAQWFARGAELGDAAIDRLGVRHGGQKGIEKVMEPSRALPKRVVWKTWL